MAEDLKAPVVVASSLAAVRDELRRTQLSASTVNFIVWLDDPARRDWILQRAAMIGDKYPSLTLILDKSGGCPVDKATIESGEGARRAMDVTVQGERAIVDAGCATPAELAEYVVSLEHETVPTVLWWTGVCLEEEPDFDALLPHVDALVVDSSGGTRDDTTLRQVVRFARAHPQTALHDLAWMRVRPWRDMIAYFFDDPHVLEDLLEIRALHIESGSDAEAVYLGGWLASRLGWTAKGRDVFADRRGKDVAFEHVRGGTVRRIHSLCLDSEGTFYHGEVTTEDGTIVRLWSEGERATGAQRLHPLQAVDNASLIECAILERATDEVFETALRSVATLLG